MSITQKVQLVGIFICVLLLFFFSSNARSLAQGLAEIPLTKATPESQNLSSSRLNEAIIKIKNRDYGQINSLLVTRNHYLVLENYFSMYDRDQLHPVYSVTKSITSALIGIAIKQGKIKGTQTKILEFFPEHKNYQNRDILKEKINLENVLTMTAGFQWDEFSTSYFNPENDARKMASSPDPIKFMLDLEMSDSIGNFVYNSGGSMLLSGVLKNTTKQSVEGFAKEHLFQPLGIKNWQWSTVSNSVTNTGWGLSLTPFDMARFGILFLNEGRWHNTQVVPRQWQQISTGNHVKTGRYGYGYQWWRFLDDDPTVSNLAINDVFFAWGFGGQFIFVIPHLKMVLVSTGENFSNSQIIFDALRDYIFPAVLN